MLVGVRIIARLSPGYRFRYLRNVRADSRQLLAVADVFLHVSVTAEHAGRAPSKLASDDYGCTTVAFLTELKDAHLQEPRLRASDFCQV